MKVKQINSKETYDFILNKHYAQRKPSISWAFGLFEQDQLVGILTIGKPASHSLCIGICGKEYEKYVYELNRLCVNEGLPKNTLSWFVSQVLKKLKNEKLILVSYADEGMGHHGYIYQATNWIYTGKTKQRTDKYTPPGKHSRHYSNDFNHLRKVRTAKHRYVYFTNKKFKPELNYTILPYPKGDNRRYKFGDRQGQLIFDKNKGVYYNEY